MNNTKYDHDHAGHGPADKDAECDAEKEPEEPSIGKEAAAIVVDLTSIEAAGIAGKKRNHGSGSEEGRGNDSNDSVFGDHRRNKIKDALKVLYAKDTTDNRVRSREKEADYDIKHG